MRKAMKKRTGCVDSLSDKESDRTRQNFPALSLTNVLALGPGFRVSKYPSSPYSHDPHTHTHCLMDCVL